jgi:hypothetical protein
MTAKIIAWPGHRRPVPPKPESIVYFVRIGRFIKIGVTTNLKLRMKSFRTSTAENIVVLLTVPGDRHLERGLHNLFVDDCAKNELFYDDWLLPAFITIAKTGDYASAIQRVKDLKQTPAAERRRILAKRALRDKPAPYGLIEGIEKAGLKIRDIDVRDDRVSVSVEHFSNAQSTK